MYNDVWGCAEILPIMSLGEKTDDFSQEKNIKIFLTKFMANFGQITLLRQAPQSKWHVKIMEMHQIFSVF